MILSSMYIIQTDLYLSFFRKTCLREPLTIYSVTVAKLVTGPSETTPYNATIFGW